MPRNERTAVLFTAVPGALALGLLLAWPLDAAAVMHGLGFAPDTRERLLLSAFSGFTLGLALGLLVYELRARGIAIALRRLTDLAASIDGRMPDDSRRGAIKVELERLSDEVLFSARRRTQERREFDNQATAWQAMFAATLDPIFVLDGKGMLKELNPAAERQFRLTPADAIGRHLADLLFPLPHRALDHAAFMQDLAAGKAVGRRQELVVHCGQRQFPVDLAIAEFHVGDEPGMIVTARDISAQRQTRSDLKRVREQADRLQARLRAELASRRGGRSAPETLPLPDVSPAVIAATSGGTPFTLEEACGDVIRKLVVKAERKGMGFRYEDSEVQGTGLIGDATRLRAVVSDLIDSVIRHGSHGEIIVHFAALSTDERSLELVVRVTATGMTEEQSRQVGHPVIAPLKGRARTPREAQVRSVEVAGVPTQVAQQDGTGIIFTARMHYAVDLSRVAIDLGALAGVTASVAADADADPRLIAEFARAATRLRHNADKSNLGALWAQAHRLKETWLPRAPLADAGLVSALAHTARGGDAANACMLARRLADSLDVTVRQHMSTSDLDLELEEPAA